MSNDPAVGPDQPIVVRFAAPGRQARLSGFEIDLIKVWIAMVGVGVAAFPFQRDSAEEARPAAVHLGDAVAAQDELCDPRRGIEDRNRLEGLDVEDLHLPQFVLEAPVHTEIDRGRGFDQQKIVSGPREVPQLLCARIDCGQDLVADDLHDDAAPL